jgi:hypothetical protein
MTANGHDVSVLHSIIEARRKELGETTKQAATATAIQVVKSIRANTRIADPDAMDVKVRKSDSYVVSWRKVGGKNERCIRLGSHSGAVVSIKSVVDLLGGYVKGQVANVYSVLDIVKGSKKSSRHYIVLASDMKTATEYAKEKHRKRVKRYSGMARYALTLAMMKTARKGFADKSDMVVTNIGKRTAMKNVDVHVKERGFDSGELSIDIHDALDYATGALQDGAGYVQRAVQKASNSIVGMINHRLKEQGSFHKPFKVPFPKE